MDKEMNSGFNLSLSAKQERIKKDLHGVARTVLRPAAAAAERDGADLAALHARLAGAGIDTSALLLEGVADPHTLLVASEELAYGDPGIAWALAPAWQLAHVVGRCGTSAQKKRAHAAFSTTARVMLYEDFGRQPSELETRAKEHAGQWTIEGGKSSVSHPAGADVSLLVALDQERRELSAFFFTGDRPGITVARDDRGVGKLAVTAVPSGSVTISGLVLHAEDRLAGGIELHRAIGQARLLLGATLLGTARASVELCAAYALERKTWGQPIAEYQAVSFPIIEHSTEINEVRLLLWDFASKIARLHDIAAIEKLVARAVNRASSLAMRATRDGVQLIGVRAITRDMPTERWYRSAAVLGAIDFDILQTPFGLS